MSLHPSPVLATLFLELLFLHSVIRSSFIAYWYPSKWHIYIAASPYTMYNIAEDALQSGVYEGQPIPWDGE